MAQFCEITGAGPAVGNLVSHANNKNRTRWMPNLKYKRYVIDELERSITLRVSTRGIKTIQKHGSVARAIFKVREDQLSERLKKIKRDLEKRKKA
ncbi:MAG: 50S ribosomal protein L28 [Oligoflexia bacterium]|nr:50S ribosomal protein L28 [Oligoflexia bacterium]